MDQVFRLDILTPVKADVYLACRGEVPWDAIQRMDAAGYRVVGDLVNAEPDVDRVRRIMRACSAVVVTPDGPARGVADEAEALAAELRIPVYPLDAGDRIPPLKRSPETVQPYAFMIGRLERDFTLARAAIRSAVESEAGITCLWSDDGRHRTNIDSVRERTRQLIRHATFVIAELTLGVENPDRENPSRAHEIGMAMAYERKLLLSSQEPRRDPYFSVGDMQMTFWDTEDELERQTREWIRVNREWVARRVYNGELAESKLDRPTFTYDPGARYIGPNTRIRK